MRHRWTVVPAGLALFAATLAAGVGRASPPNDVVAVTDERFGHPIAPILLLARPDVQADLQLNPRQIAGARKLAAELAERLLLLKNRTGQAEMSERRQIDETMATWLRRELAPVQLDRLSEISLQWEGVSALRRPSVVEFLVLGQPQRRRIDQLLADRDRRQAGGSMAPGEVDRISREVLSLLAPVQLEKWRAMLGSPCQFAIAGRDAPHHR